jgi:hypothetical protein
MGTERRQICQKTDEEDVEFLLQADEVEARGKESLPLFVSNYTLVTMKGDFP